MIQNILHKIRNYLKENIDDHILYSEKKYFKEEIKLYGVRVSTVTKFSKELYKSIQDESKETIFEICEEL